MLEATSVMCQLNVKLASKKIPRLFADFDGVIDFPSRVTQKSGDEAFFEASAVYPVTAALTCLS